ncbi:MAG: sensor domain-containing diguanylate cyclase, partial [Patescibacteria group bacterium]
MKSRHLHLMLILACGFLLLPAAASALEKVLDAGQMPDTAVSMTHHISYLEDASLALTLADVQQPGMAASFKVDDKATD